MRQGPGSRRSRGRSNGKRSFGQGPNRSFESNGPGVKLRGTAAQVFEKYLALARDASSSGDRIASENFYHSAVNAERKLKTESERAEEEDRQEEGASETNSQEAAPKAEPAEAAVEVEAEAATPDAAETDEEAPKPAPKPRRRRRAAPKDTEAETSA